MKLMVFGIKDISLPERSVIATVLREQDVKTATGDLQLLAGDRVLVFTHADEVGHKYDYISIKYES